MYLVATRTYPFLDAETLVDRRARDSLFRIDENRFLLHMASEDDAEDERSIWLDSRAALLWLNETPDEYGSQWQ
jgi:hypothetical protein